MIDFLSAYLIYSIVTNIIGTILIVWISWMLFYPTIYLAVIKDYDDYTIKEKLIKNKKLYISGFVFMIITMIFMPSEKDFVALYSITHSEQINDVMIKYLEKK